MQTSKPLTYILAQSLTRADNSSIVAGTLCGLLTPRCPIDGIINCSCGPRACRHHRRLLMACSCDLGSSGNSCSNSSCLPPGTFRRLVKWSGQHICRSRGLVALYVPYALAVLRVLLCLIIAIGSL